MVEIGKKLSIISAQETEDLQVNHSWCVQQLVPRLCFLFFFVTSMSKPFSHSDPVF